MRTLKYLFLVICLVLCGGYKKVFAEENVYSHHSIKLRIVRESINQGIDPALALSLVKQESGFNRAAKSRVGAIGLFQLMPQTARGLDVNPYYIDQNIEGGLTYLRNLKDEFGSTKLALAAYNAGPGAVKKYGWKIPPYRETRHYVVNIMSSYHRYKSHTDPAIAQIYKESKENIMRQQFSDRIGNNSIEKPPAISLITNIWKLFVT